MRKERYGTRDGEGKSLTKDAFELVTVSTTVLATVPFLKDTVTVETTDGCTGNVLSFIDVAAVPRRLVEFNEGPKDNALVICPLEVGN